MSMVFVSDVKERYIKVVGLDFILDICDVEINGISTSLMNQLIDICLICN